MPSSYVKTVEDLIFYEYAKLINKAAKMPPNNFAFRTSVWKKLKSGEITMSGTMKEWIKERSSRDICNYCGSTEDIQTEHIIPRSLGGPDIPDNFVDSCAKCNRKKGKMHVFEFCKLQEIEVPRIVKGKYLKLVYREHDKHGTLQMNDIDGDGKLDLYDLCAIFQKEKQK